MSRHLVNRLLCLLCLLCTLCASGLATAEPEPQPLDETARRSAYEEGKKAADAKRWTEALIIYVRLWRDRPTYDVALMLGQSELNLKQYRLAAEHLSYGIRHLPPREKPEVLERAQQMLALVKAEISSVEFSVSPAGAEIAIDGQRVGTAPLDNEIFLDPGEHEIVVTAPGHQAGRRSLEVTAGEGRSVTMALAPDKAEPAPSPVAPSEPAPAPTVIHRSSWIPVYIGGALTVAGVAAGVGFGLARASNDDEQRSLLEGLNEDECAGPAAPPACARLPGLSESYDRNSALSVAGYVTAGVAGIGTIAYFLIARPDQARRSADGQDISKRARLVPIAVPSGAGLRLVSDF
jgi:hypothetical protein